MKLALVPEVDGSRRCARRREAIEIDDATSKYQNTGRMKPAVCRTAAFSLVEVTLAIGVAAFCLITVFALIPVASSVQQASIQQTAANDIMSMILGDLRADVRLPPGQYKHYEEDSGYQLHGHWLRVSQPDTMFFTNDLWYMTPPGPQSGDPAAPAGAMFRAKITYLFPPNASTSVAKIIVSWPAAVIPATGGVPAGSVETVIAINR